MLSAQFADFSRREGWKWGRKAVKLLYRTFLFLTSIFNGIAIKLSYLITTLIARRVYSMLVSRTDNDRIQFSQALTKREELSLVLIA